MADNERAGAHLTKASSNSLPTNPPPSLTANLVNTNGLGDLLSLDDETSAALETGAGASGQDTIVNAAEMFQAQLEQMTTWKHQLAQQMEVMRHDGLRLLERQKNLSLEKKRLLEERTQIAAERERIEKASGEMAGTLARLEGERENVEKARQELALLQVEFETRQKGLSEQEQLHEMEDARLREGLIHLETKQAHLTEAYRQAADEKAAVAAQAQALESHERQLSAREETLAQRDGEVRGAREELAKIEAQLKAKEETLLREAGDAAARTKSVEEELQGKLAAVETTQRELGEARQAITRQRLEFQRKLDALEAEQTEHLETLAKQTKRLSERRAEVEASEADLENALASRIAQATGGLKEEASRLQQEYATRSAALERQMAEARGAAEDAATTRQKLQAVEMKATALQTAKDELEFQLEVHTDDAAKQLEALRADMSAELTRRDAQIAALKEQYEAALAAPATTTPANDDIARQGLEALTKQVSMLEQQRNELAAQLFEVQDKAKRYEEAAVLRKKVLEEKVAALEQRNATLEAENSTWQKEHSIADPGARAFTDADAVAAEKTIKQASWHKERLLRQAKALRGFRQQIREVNSGLENSRGELAHHREQLRARKENLEQVKRLLEKQEMVMARKLADHNAIKTVAVVGIFVIMILGSTFLGVYRFVKPVYRSEAVVQLSPGPGLEESRVQAWMNRQLEFMGTNEVTSTAWKVLRSSDEHYSMHDVRDEWLASLAKHLSMKLDRGNKTLAIQYSGPDAEGVSQVCNALATAYATPGMRDSTESTKSIGLGAQVLAKATVPLYPAEDNRLMISLSIVAIVLFVSLLLVMVFRHFVAQQLKEIDQMADAQDLEELAGDLPVGARPAGA